MCKGSGSLDSKLRKTWNGLKIVLVHLSGKTTTVKSVKQNYKHAILHRLAILLSKETGIIWLAAYSRALFQTPLSFLARQHYAALTKRPWFVKISPQH